MTAILSAVQGDISRLTVQAIVNAANEPLIMGGGVDGAIRGKAGPDMEAEIRRIGRCPTGEAVLTRGYALPAQFVIHTVAPIWNGDETRRKADISLLARCYDNVLAIAQANGISEVAFPCLGTGIYGWPGDVAADVAFASVCESIRTKPDIAHILFCCFSRADLDRYNALIALAARAPVGEMGSPDKPRAT